MTREAEKEFEEWWRAEKEFEEWWRLAPPFIDLLDSARQAYLEAHSQQEERIERLREGIKCFLSRLKGEDHGIPGFVLDELQKLLEES